MDDIPKPSPPTKQRELEIGDLERLAAIVEWSNDPIIGKDIDGIITSWNPAAARLYEYTADEAIGQSIRIIIPKDRDHEEDETLARIRHGEQISNLETVRVTKDGRLIEVSLSIDGSRRAGPGRGGT